MTTPTIFRVIIFFHCLSVFSHQIRKKTLTVLSEYRAGTLIDSFVQHLLKDWKELFTESQFTDFSKAMDSNMLFENRIFQFRVLPTRSEGMFPLLQQKTLVDVGHSTKGEEGVDTAAFDRSANTNGVLRYVTYLMFDSLYLLNQNRNLYPKG